MESTELVTPVKETKRTVRTAIVFAVPTEFAIPKPGMSVSPIEMYQGESRKYCPGFSGLDVLRGIPLEDERNIPAFTRKLGVSPESNNFEEAVKNFWINYTTNIPFAEIIVARNKAEVKIEGAKTINASYEIRTDGKIYPDNIDDYILYELLIKEGRRVSQDPSKYTEPGDAQFFCVSAELDEERKKDASEMRQQVYHNMSKLYMEADNEERVRFIVSLVSSNITAIGATKLTRLEAIEEIGLAAEKNPERFLKVVQDKNLNYKSLIKQFTESNLLNKQGDTYFYGDEAIGNLHQTILFVRNPENHKIVESLKKRLDSYKSLV